MQTPTADPANEASASVSSEIYDVLIVGGGINGAGIARDAAGRGLKVLLVEKEDLAQHTSSASTKLIHGGLRYLEYYEFRLVREALIERERLLNMAPHIIWPLSFVLPQVRSPRPSWLVRLGLFIYDHLGGRKKLPATRTIPDLSTAFEGNGLKAGSARAFVYSDCWVEDSRLVVLNAMDAAARGAKILTRTRFEGASRGDTTWSARISRNGQVENVQARLIVNAAGPWVEDVLGQVVNNKGERGVRLIKGSHIVLPRLFEGDHAFMLQKDDKRIVFAIPYEGEFTLVGTTDIAWEEAPGAARISDQEVEYLLQTVRDYFERDCGADDIVWTYSGIRPLYDDRAASASAVTRDYVLDFNQDDGAPPLLSIFGGKITTYRKLAEHALEMISPSLSVPDQPWTASEPLPGGDIADADFEAFLTELVDRYGQLSKEMLRRYARAYGTCALKFLGVSGDLGSHFGDDVYQAEIDYLVSQEWAVSAEDILFRRSKLGLHIGPDTLARLKEYLGE